MNAPRKTTSPWPWARPASVPLMPGEQLVWEGSPSFRSLALRLYRVQFIAGWCFLVLLADVVQARLHQLGTEGALRAAIPGSLTFVGVVGIVCLLALGSARTTRYTLTDRRLVMQCGLALSFTLAMPLHRIAAVAVRVRGDGTGDITLLPHAGTKLGFLKLWPFARPWHLRDPEPMLREVPIAGWVGGVLSRLVADAQRAPVAARDARPEPVQPAVVPVPVMAEAEAA